MLTPEPRWFDLLERADPLFATYPAWNRFWEEEKGTGFYPPGRVDILSVDDLGELKGMRFSTGAAEQGADGDA